ncbi:MAG TPA: tRNA-(ms[2]io[6]A)-hydroxylase [Pirellulales bacterium]|jgi:tRNA-(ms[2]io[6]A)-hydroxylase|nr:tRNA-(ms[2]io[6]A)-hydroxylase [Pirellulales bacterium]
MLNLKCVTESRWLAQVDRDLASILIDHAHCEKKAAGTAMNLLFAYGTVDPHIGRQLSDIVVEELDHFRQVLDLLDEKGIRFGSQQPGHYGRKLTDLVRKGEPHRAIDRLLVAALIEARSCERFALLRDHVADSRLAEFYGSLFESEARHHGTYVQLARRFGDADAIHARLEELAADEALIIGSGDPLPRMHS